MKYQDPSMYNSNVTGGIKKRDAGKDEQTSQKQYAPPTFSKLGA